MRSGTSATTGALAVRSNGVEHRLLARRQRTQVVERVLEAAPQRRIDAGQRWWFRRVGAVDRARQHPVHHHAVHAELHGGERAAPAPRSRR